MALQDAEKAVAGRTLGKEYSTTNTSSEANLAREMQKADENDWRNVQEKSRREKVVDLKAVKQKAEQIGITRNKDTGEKSRNRDEADRYDKITKAGELCKKFSEKGYDGLTNDERRIITNQIETVIDMNPQLKAQYDGAASNADRELMIKRILGDPKFAPYFGQEVKSVMDSDEMTKNEKIDEQGRQLEEKKIIKEDLEKEVSALNTRVTELRTESDKFARTGITPVGDLAKRLDGLRLNKDTFEREIQEGESTLENLDFDLKQLIKESDATVQEGATKGRRSRDVIKADIDKKRDEIKTKKMEVDGVRKKIAEIGVLENQEKAVKEQLLAAEKDLRTKNIDCEKAKLNYFDEIRKFADLKQVRTDEEKNLVDRMESIFAAAADKYFVEKINDGKAKAGKIEDDKKQQARDNNEKAMYDALREVFLSSTERVRMVGVLGHRRQERYRPIDRAVVDRHFSTMLYHGPESVMRDLLATRINPATNTYYQPGEIDALFANKGADSFYKKMESETAIQLTRKKMESSGLRPEDVEIITSSPWGKDAIAKALTQNKEAHAQLEAAMNEKVLANPGFAERFGQKARKNPWLLYSLLGIPALIVQAAGPGGVKSFSPST